MIKQYTESRKTDTIVVAKLLLTDFVGIAWKTIFCSITNPETKTVSIDPQSKTMMTRYGLIVIFLDGIRRSTNWICWFRQMQQKSEIIVPSTVDYQLLCKFKNGNGDCSKGSTFKLDIKGGGSKHFWSKKFLFTIYSNKMTVHVSRQENNLDTCMI